MNLFVLDKDPAVAVQYLCDLHINKMLTESVQILSDHSRNIGEHRTAIYDAYNPNHPIVRALRNWHTYMWVIDYVRRMILEREFRGMNSHEAAIKFMQNDWIDILQPYDPNQCTFTVDRPDIQLISYSVSIEETVKQYREFYHWKYYNFIPVMRWTIRGKPVWLNVTLREK